MQLTKYTDFSLRLLIYAALHPNRRVTITEVSDTYRASKNHFVKIVHRLVQLGYLTSAKGRNGGLSLAISPADIYIGKVVRDMEATLDVVDCNATACPILPACKLKGALAQATQAFLSSLDNITLEDLTQNQTDLLRLIE